MKIKILFIFIVALCFSVFSSLAAGASMFTDVPATHNNYDAIYYLKNTGVVQGDSGQDPLTANYRPGDSINRAEFLKIVYEGHGLKNDKNYNGCFPDVGADEWYTPYVCQAKEDGVIGGYPDGKFRPEQTINQAEALKIMSNSLGWGVLGGEGEEWHRPYYDFASVKNISPVSDVAQLMNRGDIAEMVFRNNQISTLQLNSYNPDLDPILFQITNVPVPPTMSIVNNVPSIVISGPADGLQRLGEDYFYRHYCYYSDDGDHAGDNLEFMRNFTQDDFDRYVEGSDISEYFAIFCYENEQITDLSRLTDAIREEGYMDCWTSEEMPAIIGAYGATEALCHFSDQASGIDAPQYFEVGVPILDPVSIDYDAENVKIFQFSIGSIGQNTARLDGFKLHSFAEGKPYGIRHLTVKDDNGETVFEKDIYVFDWVADAITITFEAPFLLEPGHGKTFEVLADFDWEYHSGDIVVGFSEAADILSNGVAELGVNTYGALLELAGSADDEVEYDGFPLCTEADTGADDDAGDAGSDAGDAGSGGDGSGGGGTTTTTRRTDPAQFLPGSHFVRPIEQQGGTCYSAATYSSLRWMEEHLREQLAPNNIDLVDDGQAGYDGFIDLLHPPMGFWTGAYGQNATLVEYINENFGQCVSASTNSDRGWNVTCEELIEHYDNNCDTIISVHCVNKTDEKDKWGHAMDMVDVEINADGKCQMTLANSWDARIGEIGVVDQDGLGGGTYHEAEYDYDTNKFEVWSDRNMWKDYDCTLTSATYMCPVYSSLCQTGVVYR